MGLHVDLKLTTRLDELCAALERFGVVERTVVSSTHVASLREVARQAPSVRVGFTFPEDRLGVSRRPVLQPLVGRGLTAARAFAPRLLPRMVARAGASVLMLQHRLATRSAIARMHAIGDPGAGVDGRRPGRARAGRRRRCGRRDHERPSALRLTTVPHGLRTGSRYTHSTHAPPGNARDSSLLSCAFCRIRGDGRRRRHDPDDADDPAADRRADDDAPSTTPTPHTKLIQPGVTIGGVLVGGFTKAEARELVLERFDRPVTLVVSPTRKLRVTAKQLGASLNLDKAVGLAVRVRQQGYHVPLDVDVAHAKLDRFLSGIARQTDRDRSTRHSCSRGSILWHESRRRAAA